MQHTVIFTDTGIRIGNQDYPLWSGSFHYWRSEQEHWEGILQKIGEMGFRIVESYIPWGVHEVKKGTYDFGSIDPRKNLRLFLELCKKHDLFVFLRPGPHINAELDCFGFPERIVFNPKYMARSAYGTPVTYPYATRPFPIPSYASNEFMEEVWEYFDAVYEEIADYLYPAGTVVALQSDNEYCHFFRDSAYILDYSADSIKAYHNFLCERYQSAQSISAAYNETIKDISNVIAPTGFFKDNLTKCYDWVCFKEWQITDTVRKITQYWRDKGIQLPIYHNIAFQYYTPIDLVSMEREAADLVGMDIYLRQYEGEDIRKKCRYLSGSSKLAYVPEFISGVWFDNPDTPSVAEQKFITLYSLMNGLKAINFYMIVERDRWQGCPVTVDGRVRREYFDFYDNLTGFVNTYGLNRHTRTPKILLLKNYELGRFQSLYSQADFSPLLSNAFVRGLEIPRSLFTPQPCLGLEFEQQERKHWCEERWIDRIANRLTAQGEDYNISDTQLPLEQIQKYDVVYASSFECMSAQLQQKLLDYAQNGGRLVLPRLPKYDLRQKPCTILANALEADNAPDITVMMENDPLLPLMQREISLHKESGLEYVLHRTAKALLLFVANPTDKPCTGIFNLHNGAKLGAFIWRDKECSIACSETSITITMQPYTVCVWEVLK